MAMQESKLAQDLEAIFDSMVDAPMSNHDYAARLAKAVTDQVKTATVEAGIPTDGTQTTAEGIIH